MLLSACCWLNGRWMKPPFYHPRFCQRMLTHNAFESGVLFEQTLIQDEHPVRKQACEDFWRRHCYPLPVELARAITQLWSDPEALLRDIYPAAGELPDYRCTGIG